MEKSSDIVFLVHGLGGSRIDMWPLARQLRRSGFEVKNWSYRTLGHRIETHANRLGTDLTAIDNEPLDRKIHIVTHSMGGIITRSMLADFSIQNLGRIVMLVPPNQGSHIARKAVRYFGWLTPSLQQLSDAPDSFVNQLPNTLQQQGIEFGIIESTKDRVIAQGGAHLDGYRDYARLDIHHGVIQWYSQTIQIVGNFLLKCRFDTSDERH